MTPMSGEEEGVYGWLTVNNALDTILAPANRTVGALDLGGASAQITFSPVHTSVIEVGFNTFPSPRMDSAGLLWNEPWWPDHSPLLTFVPWLWLG